MYDGDRQRPVMKYTRAGSELARDWGVFIEESESKTLFLMSDQKRTVSLLAIIAERLLRIERTLSKQHETAKRTQREAKKPGRDDCNSAVADGVLAALGNIDEYRGPGLGLPIPNPLPELMSARAKKAIQRSGLKWVSQISPDRLRKTRNVGAVTIAELMAWAQQWEREASG